jgi:hypothetical protein
VYLAPSEMVQVSLAPSEMLACLSCCGWLTWQMFWLVGWGFSFGHLRWWQMVWPLLGFGGLVSVQWLRDVRRQQRLFLAFHNGMEKSGLCRQCVLRLSWRRRRDGSGSVWVRAGCTSHQRHGCPKSVWCRVFHGKQLWCRVARRAFCCSRRLPLVVLRPIVVD